MKFTSEVLVLLALLPLLAGIVLELLGARFLSGRAKGVLALACCVPSFAAVAGTFVRVRQSGPIDFMALGLDGPMALAFHVDALSLLFALMATALGSMVLLYSIDYMAEDPGATRFYCTMLAFICGMVGLVYSSNLFFVYLNWEAMGLCSFSLVGFWYEQKAAVAGARKVLLMTHLAGYGLLAAILIIYARTGSALWTDPAVSQAFTGGIFVLMLVALLAKSVQFPLHTWIPEAMNAPTPVSALLQPVAVLLGFDPDVGRNGHHAGGRGICDGAARPEAHACLPHSESDRLHHDRARNRNAAGDCGSLAALPESQPVQGRPVSGGRFCATCHRNPRHEQAWRLGHSYANHHNRVADQRWQHDGRTLHERLREQVAALYRGAAGRPSGPCAGCLGG
jgi:hypothetical protein